jgi:hypothetical protein
VVVVDGADKLKDGAKVLLRQAGGNPGSGHGQHSGQAGHRHQQQSAQGGT